MFNYKSKNRGWLDTFGKGGNLNKIGAPKYKSMQEAESDPNLNKPIYSGTPYNTNKDNSEVFQTGKNKGKVTGKGAIEESISPLDFIPALDAAAITMKGIGILGKEALNLGEKAIQNTWRLNPKAYQYNIPKDKMFRGLGKGGADDAIKSGVFRPKQNVEPIMYNGFDMSKQFNGTYYTPKFETANQYGKGFIAEVPKDATDFRLRYKGKGNKTWSQIADENIPIEKGKILKKDWLKGYKEVPKPQQTFKSEINWGKWNKEIPENTQLLEEYNTIEQTSKANGSWMKNPDGSPFQGTPEQFVQQNSQNFKKAFGNSKLINPDGSPTIQYHGSAKKFDTFDESKFQLGDSGYSGKGIYTTPDKNKASSYALSSKSIHTGEYEPTVYELYGQGNNPISAEDLIKQNKDYDLFNFHRQKDWRGDVPLEEQLLDYDVAIRNQTRGIERIAPWHQANELVFPTNKQVKSAIGNNGMFDMTNPNIYKALFPAAIGLGAASQIDKKEFGGNIIKKNGGWLDKLN